MADPILHIKDSYYFEVPKALAPASYGGKWFPKFWVRLDDQFQEWEAERLYHEMQKMESLPVAARADRLPVFSLPPFEDQLKAHDKDGDGVLSREEAAGVIPEFEGADGLGKMDDVSDGRNDGKDGKIDADEYNLIPRIEKAYEEWKHDHAHHGKPFDVYLEHHADLLRDEFQKWKAADPARKDDSFETFLIQGSATHSDFGWFAVRKNNEEWAKKWTQGKETAGGDSAVKEFQEKAPITWTPDKIAGYNKALAGKILIPQPFGEQKNLYEMEPGSFGVSKFMILEVFVAVMIAAIFIWLAGKVKSSDRPKGKIWNMLEAVLLFIRDQIARPAIDAHHDEGHGEHEHGEPAHAEHGHGEHAHAHKPAHAAHAHEGDKYVPYLWTVFLFILGCNLVGMFPWAGAPAASLSVTLALALVTFLVGLVSGVAKFGFVGYWKNQVPSMELPIYMAIPLLPAIFVIEVMGLFIKHGVLGIRLLANIAAGHLVLVSLLGLTFAAGASESMGIIWPFASIAVVLGSAALSCLELFVAFLQAYVFTLLSALFIGAAVHRH